MFAPLLLLSTWALLQVPPLESKFIEVAPARSAGKFVRSEGQTRAVVLIPGFRIHFSEESVPLPFFHAWQQPRSSMVKELARDSDVFSFTYGQNVCLTDVVERGRLADAVRELQRLGYGEIVLVGHSAGGLVARQFVEDHPTAGVTKVIQVCSPNGGSPVSGLPVPKNQQVFLNCLTTEGRQQCLKTRAGKVIPEGVQFICVVGRAEGFSNTDGVVPCVCQWTDDLQKQGIPALGLVVNHREAMRSLKGARAVAELVREKQSRWPAEKVRKMRKEILGE